MSLYYLIKPTNPPYPTKNAGSWQISPSTLTIPPRGSGLSMRRLRPIKTRLRTSSTQVFYYVRAISLIRFSHSQDSLRSTHHHYHQTRDSVSSSSHPRPKPPPVASVSLSHFAAPFRSTSHHQAAKQPECEIVSPRDKARISTHSGLIDDPATREYVIGHASVSCEQPNDNVSREATPRCAVMTIGTRVHRRYVRPPILRV